MALEAGARHLTRVDGGRYGNRGYQTQAAPIRWLGCEHTFPIPFRHCSNDCAGFRRCGCHGCGFRPAGAKGAHPGVNTPRSVSKGFFSLEISPDRIELGVVNNGQVSKAALKLTNRGSRVLLIDRLETGCPCLLITPEQLRIGPSESEVVAVTFDPSGEPDFHGRLSIDISGYSTGKLAFRTVGQVEVRKEVDSPAARSPEPATIGENQP
jgi:Protein of unknown function (DUF1573)